MKTQKLLWIALFAATAAQAQTLRRELNLPRLGDVIYKQQVEWKDPGRSGKDVIWDFGRLKQTAPQYRLQYSAPPVRRNGTIVLGKDTFAPDALAAQELIVGREHQTMYFYRLKDGILSCLGYQNNTDRMCHLPDLPMVKFPMAYGDSLSQTVRSEDLYAGQVPILTHGDISIVADACGTLILPTGDTLHQALRIHSVQSIVADTVAEMDSLCVQTRIETYRWYARGYRYPLFETIRTVHHSFLSSEDDVQDTVPQNNIFETALLYPPPQNRFDEQNPDSANIAELALLEAELEAAQNDANPWAGMTYNIFPNPAYSYLQFEIDLPRDCNEVVVQLRSQMGQMIFNENKGAYSQGVRSFSFNMNGLPIDNYILDFWLEGYPVHGAVIMKR